MSMIERLQQRLQSLKSEYETYQTMLAELEAKQASLQQTLLRLGGAIQVIEEELQNAGDEEFPMKTKLEQRLQSLKSEYETYQTMLAEVETKQASLQQTLLRLGGAIQVIEEELQNIE